VLGLGDPLDRAVVGADDAPVPGRVELAGREQRRRGLLCLVVLGQLRDERARGQRHVA
jgi:hypothetical protein